MQCLYCEKELLKRQKMFCSDKCRKAHSRTLSRTSVSAQKLDLSANIPERGQNIPERGQNIPERGQNIPERGQNIRGHVSNVSALSREELYIRIYRYREDTWKDSPEYRELLKRLKAKSVGALEREGYWIPNWKKHNLPCPIKL